MQNNCVDTGIHSLGDIDMNSKKRRGPTLKGLLKRFHKDKKRQNLDGTNFKVTGIRPLVLVQNSVSLEADAT